MKLFIFTATPKVDFYTVNIEDELLQRRLFQITNLMQNSFIFQQYVCYTTLLNMFRAARCSKHVEERSDTYILLKNKIIVH